MKKKRMALIIVICTVVAGFLWIGQQLLNHLGDASSIGMIGGADGPTGISVSAQVNDALIMAVIVVGVTLAAALCAYGYRKIHK